MIFKKQYIITALLFAVMIGAFILFRGFASEQTAGGGDFKVILDAGHGSPDGGAVGVNGTIEKNINLAIVQKLRENLEAYGVKVILTREDDSGLQDADADTIRKKKVSDMNKRRKIMENSGADLFLSIHMNSLSDPSAHGLRIFYDSAHPEMESVAKELQQKISEATGAKAYAVKAADEKLFLMKKPPIPAILAECGFLSNAEEEELLNTEEYQAKIAWAIAKKLVELYVPNQ